MLSWTPQTLSTSGPFIIGQGIDAEYIGELHRRRFAYDCLHEGDVECHHGADAIQCELQSHDVEIV